MRRKTGKKVSKTLQLFVGENGKVEIGRRKRKRKIMSNASHTRIHTHTHTYIHTHTHRHTHMPTSRLTAYSGF